MNTRHSTQERLAAVAATLAGLHKPLAEARARGAALARERKADDAERDARRRVAATLGPSYPQRAPEPQLPDYTRYGLALATEGVGE